MNNKQFMQKVLQELAHRKRCTICAFALSQAQDQKAKSIIWNKFKNL